MERESHPMPEPLDLSPEECNRYEWQLWVREFGVEGQSRLKGCTAFISRIGGVGGCVAQLLTAAGIGRLVLAHGGSLRLNDLNRQVLMTTEWVGRSRVELARLQLRQLNPLVEIETIAENVSETNATRIIQTCDIVVSAAPIFAERFLMNREAVRQQKPLVDCAIYELEGRLTTILPGFTACLSCLYPEAPPHWKREFPVFGAVASTVGSLAAMEVIKVASKLGRPLANRLLSFDLRDMSFQEVRIARRVNCGVCGALPNIATPPVTPM